MIDLFRAKVGEKLFSQFQEALAVGGDVYTPEDIINACLSGEMTMIHGRDAVAVVEMQEFPRTRSMHVLIAAGDLEEIFGDMTRYVRQLACHNGCDRITMCGRRGWERAAPKVGCVPTQIMMTLHLNEDAETTNNEVAE